MHQAGVSLLLEVLFGLGLFGAVLLIVFGLFPTTHRSITQARRVTEANNLAREYLEVERAKPFQDPAPGSFTAGFPTVRSRVDGNEVSNTYNVTVAVTNVGTPASDDERQSIVVSVAWNEGPVNRTVRAEAMVTRP